MSDATRRDGHPPTNGAVPLAALWFGLLGGPAAWTVHLLASYPLVPLACESGSTAALNVLTAATAMIAAAAAGTGWWAYRRARELRPPNAPGSSDASESHAGLMGLVGVFVALLFTFAILLEGLPPLLVDPCLEAM